MVSVTMHAQSCHKVSTIPVYLHAALANCYSVYMTVWALATLLLVPKKNKIDGESGTLYIAPCSSCVLPLLLPSEFHGDSEECGGD